MLSLLQLLLLVRLVSTFEIANVRCAYSHATLYLVGSVIPFGVIQVIYDVAVAAHYMA